MTVEPEAVQVMYRKPALASEIYFPPGFISSKMLEPLNFFRHKTLFLRGFFFFSSEE